MTAVALEPVQAAPLEPVDFTGPILTLHEAGVLTSTEFKVADFLRATGDPDLDEPIILQWGAIGRWLGALQKANRFWIADWLNFGDSLWGERMSQAVNATGLKEGTLANYASVGRNVIPSRRRELASWTAHVIVAKLDADKQVEWLERAIENGWHTDELQAAIKAVEPGKREPAQPQWENDKDTRPPVDEKQVVAAARTVWKMAQRDGDVYRVPADAFARLAAALGNE